MFGEWSGLPFVVKGLLRGDDAARAVDAGAAAIAVSNHGGRVLDGIAATADVLPEMVDAVERARRGVRRRRDPARRRRVKALALGARAVMVGAAGAVGTRGRRRRRRGGRARSAGPGVRGGDGLLRGARRCEELTRDLVTRVGG